MTLSGLSPSSDTAYYQFLLKLGVIRAPTWGEKWDLYKATHSINSRSTVSPRKVREIHTRARVPFLATASSDLDYGFADGDSEEEATESVLALRFSPVTPDQTSRSDASRSLVGYTPSRTLDYDALSSNAPIRTSTPVYAQEKGYTVRGDSPPLPPYSLDDISDSLVPSDSLSAREDQSDTPKLGFAVLVDEKAWTAHEEVEMEHRADAFYVTGLLGRCWDVWHQAHTWVEVSHGSASHAKVELMTATANYGSDRLCARYDPPTSSSAALASDLRSSPEQRRHCGQSSSVS